MDEESKRRLPRLVWHDRSETEIARGLMPHLPDGMVYGWTAMDGTVYAGDGYPVSRGRFSLDTVNCASILIRRTETPPSRLEIAARALGLHRIPGGSGPHDPPTRWPIDERDQLSGRDGTVPLTWDFAQKCREEARVVAAALGGGAPAPDGGDLTEELLEFADRIDRFGFVNALPGHADTLRAAVAALRSPTRRVEWFWAHEVRPADYRRVVVLYEDGSGAFIGFWTGETLIDHDGHDYGWRDEVGARWAYLPEGFELWCETRSDDPLALPSSSKDLSHDRN